MYSDCTELYVDFKSQLDKDVYELERENGCTELDVVVFNESDTCVALGDVVLAGVTYKIEISNSLQAWADFNYKELLLFIN